MLFNGSGTPRRAAIDGSAWPVAPAVPSDRSIPAGSPLQDSRLVSEQPLLASFLRLKFRGTVGGRWPSVYPRVRGQRSGHGAGVGTSIGICGHGEHPRSACRSGEAVRTHALTSCTTVSHLESGVGVDGR